MFPWVVDESCPLVVGDVFGQWPEVLYLPEVQLLGNVGVWRLLEFADYQNRFVLLGKSLSFRLGAQSVEGG